MTENAARNALAIDTSALLTPVQVLASGVARMRENHAQEVAAGIERLRETSAMNVIRRLLQRVAAGDVPPELASLLAPHVPGRPGAFTDDDTEEETCEPQGRLKSKAAR